MPREWRPVHSFIRLYSASSRHYYSEVFPSTDTRPKVGYDDDYMVQKQMPHYNVYNETV